MRNSGSLLVSGDRWCSSRGGGVSDGGGGGGGGAEIMKKDQ